MHGRTQQFFVIADEAQNTTLYADENGSDCLAFPFRMVVTGDTQTDSS